VGGLGVIAFGFEQQAQGLTHILLIVGDEDTDAAGCRWGWSYEFFSFGQSSLYRDTGFYLGIADDPAIFQLNDAASVRGIRFRVGHLNDGSSLLIELAEQLHDLLRLAGMKITRRLIGQNHLGISC